MAENGNGRKVKGTFIIPLAMIINGRKDLDWAGSSDLTAEDLARIKERILASTWYEMDFFVRVSSAVFRLAGNSRAEGACRFGAGIMWDTLEKVYRASLEKDDPGAALSRFASLYNGIFFNTGTVEYTPNGHGGAFRIFDPAGIPVPEFFLPMLKSLLEKIAHRNNAEQVAVEYQEESLPGSRKVYSANFRIRWEKITIDDRIAS